jgi:outer membrane biosynthesis protein TonB
MELTRTEENRNKTISALGTLVIFGLFILFLILYQIVTPNPPFPETGGGGGQELALGMMNVGNNDMDYSTMGKATQVVAEKAEKAENILTDENGEPVPIAESKPRLKEEKTVITPVKPKPVTPAPEPVKEKTAAEKMQELYNKNAGKTGGDAGQHTESGKIGDPDGDPFKRGTGGTGTGSNGGDGSGTGPGGSGPGSGGGPGGRIGVDLRGRSIVTPPKLPSDTKEEGKVVVEITVNANGDVIEAIPNGRGTTTSSPLLKAKAKQAAMATKFNVDGKFDEQKGTITIIFSFN